MKSEDDPITDDEFLLRRIWKDRFRTNNVPIISPNAFEPRFKGRDVDTDGISLYREACLQSPDAILATIPWERRAETGIVRIQVGFLKSLSLSVEKKPGEQVPGHVVIPELNARDYQSDKGRFTAIKYRMAIEASKEENIVRQPELRS